MSTFEITIQRKLGDDWPVVVEPSSYLKSRVEGSLELETETLKALKRSRTAQSYGAIQVINGVVQVL